MDENGLQIIVLIILMIIVLIINVILLSWLGSNSSALQGLNKNLTKANQSIGNSINTKLNKFTNISTNIIIGTSTNTVSLITQALNSQNQNTTNLVNQVKNIPSSINKNITALQSSTSSTPNVLMNINANLVALNSIIISDVNSIIGNQLKNFNANPGAGLGTIPIWFSSKNISQGNYLIKQMLNDFNMHISVNASNSISIAVMTLAQYSNFSDTKNYNTLSSNSISIHNSTGAFNSINFQFTLSQNCDQYLYLIYGSNSQEQFTIYPNVTASYSPTISLQGVCR